MNNIVIKVLNKDHGLEVRDFFKRNGVDTWLFKFTNTVSDSKCCYYGIINGRFNNCEKSDIPEYVKILSLEEAIQIEPKPKNEYPKVMYVKEKASDDWIRRVVFAEGAGKYVAFNTTEKLEEDYNYFDITVWNFAKDIEEPLKVTLEEIAEKFWVNKVEIVEKKK